MHKLRNLKSTIIICIDLIEQLINPFLGHLILYREYVLEFLFGDFAVFIQVKDIEGTLDLFTEFLLDLFIIIRRVC